MYENKFPTDPKTLKKILESERDFIEKEDVFDIVNKINEDKNKYISLVVDSNFNIRHSKAVSGIIETNLRDNQFEKKYSNYFIPKNMNYDKIDQITLGIKSFPDSFFYRINELILKNQDYYDVFSNINKDKKVFVNESFGENPMFDKNDILSFDNVISFKQKLEILDKESQKTISFLNNNPNIHIVKTAGNNTKDLNGNQINNELKKMFDILTSYDYEDTMALVVFFNKIIQDKIHGNEIDEESKDFLKTFKEYSTKLNINYDNFIDLYLKDYLVLINNNLFIVEALNYNKILENYTHYKDYLQKHGNTSKLKNFEEDLINLNIKKDQHYNKDDISKIKYLYNEYKEILPEIFKYSTYGTISNLQYHKNSIFQRSIEGYSSYYEEDPFNGTSAACPEFLSELIIKIMTIDEQEHNVKGIGE